MALHWVETLQLSEADPLRQAKEELDGMLRDLNTDDFADAYADVMDWVEKLGDRRLAIFHLLSGSTPMMVRGTDGHLIQPEKNDVMERIALDAIRAIKAKFQSGTAQP